MEIFCNTWLIRTTCSAINNNDLVVRIKCKSFEDKSFEKIKLKIYRYLNDDSFLEINKKLINENQIDYSDLVNNKYWKELEENTILKFEGTDSFLILLKKKISGKYILIKLFVENENYNIIDIYDKNNKSYDFSWNSRLINYHRYTIRDTLLEKVDYVKIKGTPGQIQCFGKNSIGLVGDSDDRKETFAWCSAISIYGEGAILCFSHESFLFEKDGQKFISLILKNFENFKKNNKNKQYLGFLGFTDEESKEFILNLNFNSNRYSRYSYSKFVNFHSIQQLALSKNVDIIVLNGNAEEKKGLDEIVICSELLREYVYMGKIIIVGLCPWGWEQVNMGNIKNQIVSNGILKELGMNFTNEYFFSESDLIKVNSKNNRFSSSYYYWKKLLILVNQESLDEIEFSKDELYLLIKDVEMILDTSYKTNEQQKIFDMMIDFLKKDLYLNLKPPFNMNDKLTILFIAITTKRMIKESANIVTKNGRLVYSFDKFDKWINKNLFWNNNFESDKLENVGCIIDNKIFLRDNLICPVYNIRNEWQNCGIYIKHNNIVKIKFIPYISNLIINKAEIFIGSHTDFLRYKEIDILNRIPLVSKKYHWNISEHDYIIVESACDGILYFVFIDFFIYPTSKEIFNNTEGSKNYKLGYLEFTTLNESKLILSPIYNINILIKEENDDRIVLSNAEEWKQLMILLKNCFQDEISKWVEIQGKKIIFTFPIKSVIKMNVILIEELLNFWDKVVSIQDELSRNEKWYQERVVCDIQISDGYMHSGYPIMTHMDILDESEFNFLNINTLKKEGNWGLYHEIGHNRQLEDWTFGGTEEVTVNLFSMYTYHILHPHKSPFEITYIKDQLEISIDYLIEIEKFRSFPEKIREVFDCKWRRNHGIAFTNYLMLIVFFKWDALRAVFKVYKDLSCINNGSIKNQSDQYKMLVWIIIFSSVTGFNLENFFKQWGWNFCIDRVISDIDIPSLCVEMQNQLFNLNRKLCVKRKVFQEEIKQGYQDICKINEWKTCDFDSLRFLLEIKSNLV